MIHVSATKETTAQSFLNPGRGRGDSFSPCLAFFDEVEMAKKKSLARTIETEGVTYQATPSVHSAKNAHEKRLHNFDRKRSQIALSDQIAETKEYLIRWKWDKGNKHYPNEPEMRTVDKCYQFAKKGMLLVDEPMNEQEANRAYEKQKILKALGYRALVIEQDTKLDEALIQLGEL